MLCNVVDCYECCGGMSVMIYHIADHRTLEDITTKLKILLLLSHRGRYIILGTVTQSHDSTWITVAVGENEE